MIIPANKIHQPTVLFRTKDLRGKGCKILFNAITFGTYIALLQKIYKF